VEERAAQVHAGAYHLLPGGGGRGKAHPLLEQAGQAAGLYGFITQALQGEPQGTAFFEAEPVPEAVFAQGEHLAHPAEAAVSQEAALRIGEAGHKLEG